jgi:uncharacterized membrane protein
MSTRNTLILILVLVVLMVGIGLYSYPRMPEVVSVHWNAQGIANGYGSRFEAVLTLPLITIVVAALLLFIPEIDPLKANIEKFRKDFNGFMLAFALFFFYLYALTTLLNLGFQFSLNQFLVPGFGIFIYACGVLLGKAKRNFFIGIRTPWTLSSDTVWAKTHLLGGLLFKISGAIAILGILSPNLALLFLLVPLLVSSAITVVYSYFLFRSEAQQ